MKISAKYFLLRMSFSASEVQNLKDFFNAKTARIEDFLDESELAVVQSNNYAGALWDILNFNRLEEPTVATFSIALPPTPDLEVEMKKVLDLITPPFVIRIGN